MITATRYAGGAAVAHHMPTGADEGFPNSVIGLLLSDAAERVRTVGESWSRTCSRKRQPFLTVATRSGLPLRPDCRQVRQRRASGTPPALRHPPFALMQEVVSVTGGEYFFAPS